MGKKDEKIEVLESEITRLHGVIKEKNEEMTMEEKEFSGRLSKMEQYNKDIMLDKETLGQMLEDAGKSIEALKKKKSLVGVAVNIAGVDVVDMEKTLDKATDVVMARLKKLGITDIDVLAHPQTLVINLIR